MKEMFINSLCNFVEGCKFTDWDKWKLLSAFCFSFLIGDDNVDISGRGFLFCCS